MLWQRAACLARYSGKREPPGALPCQGRAPRQGRRGGLPCEALIREGGGYNSQALSKASGVFSGLAFRDRAASTVDRLERPRPTGTQRERRWIGRLERAD